MAKRKYNPKKNMSPLDEVHVREQELRMEKQRQRQVQSLMEHKRLESMLKEQKTKQILFYPYAVGCVGVLVMILYLVVKGHCLVDLPLLAVLAVLTAVLLWRQLRENQRLCDRVEEMLEERRHS